MLFSCDIFGLNSGVFLVNCTSPTAIRTLELWEMASKLTDGWRGVRSSMYEQNAIQWLLQTREWTQYHGKCKRRTGDERLTPGSLSREEMHTYSVDELRKRVRLIDDLCQLTVFPIDYVCLDVLDDKYLTKGPPWWEEGHFAVHTAGIRVATQRIPFLSNLLDSATAAAPIPPPIATLPEAAVEYLEHFQNKESLDPTKGYEPNDLCRLQEAKRQGRRKKKIKKMQNLQRLQEQLEQANFTMSSK